MAKILRGEAKPESMPIGILDSKDAITIYNPNVLNKLGLTLPDNLKESAQALDVE